MARRYEGAPEAVGIVAKGPENIISQFAVSYSMVLNLLSTRDLASCRTFFERSFAAFQAQSSLDKSLAAADKLLAEANVLDVEVSRLRREADAFGSSRLDADADLAALKVRATTPCLCCQTHAINHTRG